MFFFGPVFFAIVILVPVFLRFPHWIKDDGQRVGHAQDFMRAGVTEVSESNVGVYSEFVSSLIRDIRRVGTRSSFGPCHKSRILFQDFPDPEVI